MSKLFVIDLPQLIYAYGIPNVTIKKIYLVQARHDESREGIRPFALTEELFHHICDSLKVDREVISAGSVIAQSIVEPGDILDIQVVVKNNHLRISRKNKILCAQVEHVNLVRPSILKRWNFGLVLRLDLVRKFLFPARIQTFYTLSPEPKRGFILHEKGLDHHQVAEIRKRIANDLAENINRMNELKLELSEMNLIIVLLKAKHYGGGLFWNKGIFEIAKKESGKCENSMIVIKNHPSDDEDYSKSLVSDKQDVLYLSALEDRFIPIEILVEYAKSYQFVGTDSTVMLSLQHFMRTKPIIVDLKGWKTRREIAYEYGSIRSLFDHQTEILDPEQFQ
jgi:hypothetical protein